MTINDLFEGKREKHYIEFRVYLRDDADLKMAAIAANELQDKLTDYVSEVDECAPPIFTQDVTYEVK